LSIRLYLHTQDSEKRRLEPNAHNDVLQRAREGAVQIISSLARQPHGTFNSTRMRAPVRNTNPPLKPSVAEAEALAKRTQVRHSL
jgi:hypothetical protein